MATLTQDYERRLALEGATNFRDLGGYETGDGRRVRWRTLFRSDRLIGLTAPDVETLREIGLVTVFDLRTAGEIERHGVSPLHEHGVVHRHVPFVSEVGAAAVPAPPTDWSSAERRLAAYLDMVERARPTICEVLTALGDEEHYPAVFNCTGGKDRTGMMAALLLHALGVDDDVIAEDYALTSQYLTWTDEQLEAMAKEYNIPTPFDRNAMRADPETILGTLRGLEERYGSVLGFMQECGVTSKQVALLQERLLEG